MDVRERDHRGESTQSARLRCASQRQQIGPHLQTRGRILQGRMCRPRLLRVRYQRSDDPHAHGCLYSTSMCNASCGYAQLERPCFRRKADDRARDAREFLADAGHRRTCRPVVGSCSAGCAGRGACGCTSSIQMRRVRRECASPTANAPGPAPGPRTVSGREA